MKTVLFSFLLVASCFANWTDYYKVESVPLPKTVRQEVGGLATMSDGRIAACFYSGEVMFYQPKDQTWQPFAVGLHEPLGIVGNDDGSVTVMHWTELTKISDTDGDGLADHYQVISNDFGVSGNYHEFAYGPVKDSEGNYFVALNVASNFAGIFDHYRGPLSPIGMDEATLKTWRDKENWTPIKAQAGRMFSRVPYRGCVLKISPEGKTEVFAYGFRSPNGLCLDEKNRLWVTDNQGDWLGTSKLYHVEKDNFYGHPASLVWKPGWTRNPLKVPVEELDAMRTPASGLFPQGELANSPTQPIVAHPKFGLPTEELIIGEMNQPNLVRFLPDTVDGFAQGTLIPFLRSGGINIGNNRFTFTDDGALWVGKMHSAWAGDEGLLRITPTGKPVLVAEKVELKKDGFHISFSQPIGDAQPKVNVNRHTYHYFAKYGSPKVDQSWVKTGTPVVSKDRRSLFLPVTDLRERYLYTISFKDLVSNKGLPLMGDVLRYNLVKTHPDTEPAKPAKPDPHANNPKLPNGWRVHDKNRPQPAVVTPGTSNAAPPSDAIVLFDGKDLSAWTGRDKKTQQAKAPEWKVENGYLEATQSGDLLTKQAFGDIQLHVEWKVPTYAEIGKYQRGNSGIFLMDRYEVQVINGWKSNLYADGLTGAVYGQSPPLVNPSTKPGEWQTYDIIFTAPRFEGDKLTSPARVTVLHNGVLIQNNTEILGPTRYKQRLPYLPHPEKVSLRLQDHNDAVRYRNIWVREL